MREKLSRFIKSNGSSKKVLPIFFLVLFLGLFVFARPAQAILSEAIFNSLAWIGSFFAGLMGRLLIFIINFLVIVSGYNNFINARVVEVGWKLVRDVANMFYILVMLLMAFGTMLNIGEQYSWKKMLPRLIGTAILVNFSKTIIGLLIDFGQVIMLTFVNAYAATAGGNFAQMFGIKDMLEASAKQQGESADSAKAAFEGALGFILGAIVITVATIVTGIFAIILLLRIITLWILIILSPMAFLLGTFEKGKEYYKEWWKDLINNIIVGPLVAFFLWLTLATMGQGGNMDAMKTNNALPGKYIDQKPDDRGYYQDVGGTEISKWENLGSLLVALAMLFYCLEQIGKLSKIGGGLATGAASWMKKTATDTIKKNAIPIGLTVATGGNVPMAMAMRGGLKAGLGAAGGLPVVGDFFKGITKDADKYGLASDKGIGGWMGRKGASGLTLGKEAVMSKVGGLAGQASSSIAGKAATSGSLLSKIPWVAGAAAGGAGLLAGAARVAGAKMKGERLKPVREAEKNVSEYKDEDVVRAAQNTGFTSEAESERFAAISRILSEPKLRSGVPPADLHAMVEALPGLGETLGKADKAASLTKGFYKENPQLRTDTPATGTTPVVSAADKIKGDLKGMSPADAVKTLSVDALRADIVVGNLPDEHKKRIFADGDGEKKEALAGTILGMETVGIAGGVLTSDVLKNPAVPANQAAIQAGVAGLDSSGRLGVLPDNIFGALPQVFSALGADMQRQLIDSGKFSPSSLKPENFVTPATASSPATATAEGMALALALASGGKEDLIKEVQVKLGPEFNSALKAAVGTSTPDPRVANVLASLQKSGSDALLEAKKITSSLGNLTEAVKASNAHLMLKKLAPADIMTGASRTSPGAANADGREIYENISISMLSKVVAEAKKPGASSTLKETAATIAALVQKASTTPVTPGGTVMVRDLSGPDKKTLERLLESPSTLEAIDVTSKSGVVL